MPTITANGLPLFYDTRGNPADRCLLLIQGLGTQLLSWRDPFMKLLTDHGFFVVRYDNRDCGLSVHFDGKPAHLGEVIGGDPTQAPYLLKDFANDAVGLLDALKVSRAHLVGVSMGGMIAQTLAIEHPARVASLTSIMSTTGSLEVGQSTPEALQMLMAAPAKDRAEVLDRAVESARIIGSKTYPLPEAVVRERASAAYDRAFFPEGGGRHLSAVIASGDRTPALRQLHLPTLVIHGDEDTLIQIDGGEATAAAVPDARFLRLAGMGHDIPEPLWPQVVDAIVANADRAR